MLRVKDRGDEIPPQVRLPDHERQQRNVGHMPGNLLCFPLPCRTIVANRVQLPSDSARWTLHGFGLAVEAATQLAARYPQHLAERGLHQRNHARR